MGQNSTSLQDTLSLPWKTRLLEHMNLNINDDIISTYNRLEKNPDNYFNNIKLLEKFTREKKHISEYVNINILFFFFLEISCLRYRLLKEFYFFALILITLYSTILLNKNIAALEILFFISTRIFFLFFGDYIRIRQLVKKIYILNFYNKNTNSEKNIKISLNYLEYFIHIAFLLFFIFFTRKIISNSMLFI